MSLGPGGTWIARRLSWERLRLVEYADLMGYHWGATSLTEWRPYTVLARA
ncbi:hypothetical protein SAMN05443572_112222 [Myxococcus fulvus]|nr:hypothetical protein SAMN05443572_112222 [Myxococcus fulvus]